MSDRVRDFSLLRRLWSMGLPGSRWAFVSLVFLQLAYIPLGLIEPLPLKILVDNVVGGRPLPPWLASIVPTGSSWSQAFVVLIGSALLISFTSSLHNFIFWIQSVKVEQRILARVRQDLFEHVQEVPLASMPADGGSGALYRISQDADSANALTIGLTGYLTALVSLVTLGTVMVRMDVTLSIIALAPAPIVFLLLLLRGRRVRERWADSYDESNRAFDTLNEALSLGRVVRAFGMESWHVRLYGERLRDSAQKVVHASKTEAALDAAGSVFYVLGQVAILGIGVMKVRDGVLTLGSLLLFNAYAGQIFGPLGTLSRVVGDVQHHLAKAHRAMALLELPRPRDEATRTTRITRASGRLEFREVVYVYASRPEVQVLNRVSFSVPRGSVVGITGPSGCGKSTLLDVASGLVPPTGGVVLLDGTDMDRIQRRDLRRQFSILGQDPVLFSASLAENVRYGRPEASDEDVLRALTAAGAAEFVARLPQGLDTLVGDRGTSVSGGERQRVALARALLKSAPILLMDEPTSALDTDTEAAVLAAIASRRDTATTLLVSHSSAVLAACDTVLDLSEVTASTNGARSGVRH